MLMRMQKVTGTLIQNGTLEDSFAVSYKGKQSLIIKSSNHAPSYLHN